MPPSLSLSHSLSISPPTNSSHFCTEPDKHPTPSYSTIRKWTRRSFAKKRGYFLWSEHFIRLSYTWAISSFLTNRCSRSFCLSVVQYSNQMWIKLFKQYFQNNWRSKRKNWWAMILLLLFFLKSNVNGRQKEVRARANHKEGPFGLWLLDCSVQSFGLMFLTVKKYDGKALRVRFTRSPFAFHLRAPSAYTRPGYCSCIYSLAFSLGFLGWSICKVEWIFNPDVNVYI